MRKVLPAFEFTNDMRLKGQAARNLAALFLPGSASTTSGRGRGRKVRHLCLGMTRPDYSNGWLESATLATDPPCPASPMSRKASFRRYGASEEAKIASYRATGPVDFVMGRMPVASASETIGCR